MKENKNLWLLIVFPTDMQDQDQKYDQNICGDRALLIVYWYFHLYISLDIKPSWYFRYHGFCWYVGGRSASPWLTNSEGKIISPTFFSAAAAMHHYVEMESSHQLQYSSSLEKAGSYLFVQQMCVNITLNHFKQEVLNTDIVLVLRKFQWKLKKILWGMPNADEGFWKFWKKAPRVNER